MDNTLRVTGDNPPQQYWAQYPNWENAWDEEGNEDQDETTLKPSANQGSIDDEVTFSAGEAEFAGGSVLPALIAFVESDIDCVYVYPDQNSDRCWVISPDEPGRWDAEDGREELGLLPAPSNLADLLPLTIRSRLPLKRSGAPIGEVVQSVSY